MYVNSDSNTFPGEDGYRSDLCYSQGLDVEAHSVFSECTHGMACIHKACLSTDCDLEEGVRRWNRATQGCSQGYLCPGRACLYAWENLTFCDILQRQEVSLSPASKHVTLFCI